MHRICIIATAALVAGAAAGACGDVVHDSGGFEGERFTPGPLPSVDGWDAGLGQPGPAIVDLQDGTFGRVLRLFSPAAPQNANQALSFDPLHDGIMVISFDVMTNTNFRSLYLLATTPDAVARDLYEKTTVSMCWGATPGAVSHYAGRWIELTRYELGRWHHVDVLIHLSGAKAGQLDVNIDGGPFEGDGLPWRNRFDVSPEQPIGKLWFIGYGRPESQHGGSTERFVQIDNVVITHVPAPRGAADAAASGQP